MMWIGLVLAVMSNVWVSQAYRIPYDSTLPSIISQFYEVARGLTHNLDQDWNSFYRVIDQHGRKATELIIDMYNSRRNMMGLYGRSRDWRPLSDFEIRPFVDDKTKIKVNEFLKRMQFDLLDQSRSRAEREYFDWHKYNLCKAVRLSYFYDNAEVVYTLSRYTSQYLAFMVYYKVSNLDRKPDVVNFITTDCQQPEQSNKEHCLWLKRVKVFMGILSDMKRMPIDQNRRITSGGNDAHRYFNSLFWLLHPALRSLCSNNINVVVEFIEELSKFEDSQKKATVLSTVFDASLELKSESDRVCQEVPADPICFLKPSLELCGTVKLLVKEVEKSSWTDANVAKMKKATLLNFTPLIASESGLYKNVRPASSFSTIFLANYENIMGYVKDNDKTRLGTLRRFYSSFNKEMKFLNTNDTPQKTFVKNFRSILNQIADMFETLKMTSSGGTKSLVTSRDLKTFLKQEQMKDIKNMVQSQNLNLLDVAKWLKNELLSGVSKQFQDLKTYFTQINQVNNDIAASDISYITSMLDHFKSSVASLTTKVDDGLGDILTKAVVAAGLEIAENTMLLASRVAELCNPLSKVFGTGTVGDAIEASAKVANAISKQIKAVKLKERLTTLRSKAFSIMQRFAENDEFMGTLKTLTDAMSTASTETFESVKGSFVSMRDGFTMKVTRPELSEMTSYWTLLIDEGCKVIESGETAMASGKKSDIAHTGLCVDTKIQAEKLVATYLEIYDFQFELVDSMVNLLKAQTALHAAKNINSDMQLLMENKADTDDTLVRLQFLSAKMYITSSFQNFITMEEYCDVLQYKSAGKRPSVCQGMQSDLSSVLSYVPPGCSSESHHYVDVPTKASGNDDLAFFNLADLYDGKEVSFRIPDAAWLVSHGWITAADTDSAIYVSSFEIYMPAASLLSSRVRSTAKSVEMNRLKPSSPTFDIVPSPELTSDYIEEPDAATCHGTLLPNPYTICSTNPLPKLCLLTKDDPCAALKVVPALDPSIYSLWKVKVTGYTASLAPKPTTDLSVKVGLKICIKKTTGSRRSILSRRYFSKRSSARCCAADKFWSVKTTSCQACPAGSTPKLNGLFCQ